MAANVLQTGQQDTDTFSHTGEVIVDGSIFFTNWTGLVRIMVVGVLAYVALIGFLRISGKRTLSKMNAFDLVVTVALGSTLATIILSKDVTLAEGVMAFALLIGLQYIITWSSVRSMRVSQLVREEPTLLFYQGQALPDQLRQTRVLETEVLTAIRQQGIASLNDVEAVVLETDGTFAVVKRSPGPATSLRSLIPDRAHRYSATNL
jgi:uncharacterized membrane protein YcaP (DUF421 family)